MNEWKKVKLGDLYEVHNGLSKGRQFFGTGFPFLTFSNVFNNWFLPEELESLVQTTDKEREGCSIKAGDVFITRTSETMDELGMSSVALKDYPNATYNGFTKRLRPITNRVSPRYIGYYLRTPKFRGQFMAFSTMTTRASLANNDLLNMEVELPPMEIQLRIASILSRYDSLIENYQKQIKLLKEAAQRLYKEWFVDLHFPGHENTKTVDGVPEGWEKKKLNNLVNLQSGYAFKSSTFEDSGQYKIVTIKNVKDGLFDGDNVSFIKSIPEKMPAHCLLQTGDILLSLTGNVGRVCFVIGKNYLLNQRVAKLDSHYPAFTYCLFRNHDMFIAINNLANGAAQQNVSPIKIGELYILVADNGTMDRFEQIAGNYRLKIIDLQSQIRLLTEARDRLLPKLMSGEMAVIE
ncbi:restriction endonuclease subunit S [uncultured Prevotella sp.]|uniref:restriction endonuclease subunit S n=1 Tax=uncultured Prevotella sp. TaxID=159272 RepID=UPI002592B5B1|nr:restriction endonuclease subunit S [uncultured Prevotella sp.]